MEHMLIDRLERQTGEKADHLRRVLASSRAAWWKFALTMPLMAHAKHAPKDLLHLARLGAITTEDCGACRLTTLRYAMEGGVPRKTLEAAVSGDGGALTALERAALTLGRLVASGAPMEEEDRKRLAGAIGEKGVTELVLAAAAVRIFPALKRGFGMAESCSAVPVDFDQL